MAACSVPKFLETRKFCYNQPKVKTKKLKQWVMFPKAANGMANSKDPDQTASLGAV